MKKQYLIILLLLIITPAILLFTDFSPLNILNKRKIILNKNTSEEVESTIEKAFNENQITQSPIAVTLIILKKEAKAEVWITDKSNVFYQIITDSIPFINTKNGTKLLDNEPIIPEGVYKITTVNSTENINFTIDFPNDFDRSKQKADNRPKLLSTINFGTQKTDIILTNNLINEFLYLVKSVEVENAKVIILPNDFRKNKAIPSCSTCPQWVGELYGMLRISMKDYSK
jgi:hypothetical protein